ncbi:hypothetical protein BD779DRAFT_1480034 [Infundibulicybe gibba]|nr:hypothetical protein BD779DRAFT_1480034 [Infundibulicybe gibba]
MDSLWILCGIPVESLWIPCKFLFYEDSLGSPQGVPRESLWNKNPQGIHRESLGIPGNPWESQGFPGLRWGRVKYWASLTSLFEKKLRQPNSKRLITSGEISPASSTVAYPELLGILTNIISLVESEESESVDVCDREEGGEGVKGGRGESARVSNGSGDNGSGDSLRVWACTTVPSPHWAVSSSILDASSFRLARSARLSARGSASFAAGSVAIVIDPVDQGQSVTVRLGCQAMTDDVQ